jgi:putative transposase
MRLLLDGREYVLEERLPSGDLRLRDVVMEVPRVESEPFLVEALFDGRLTLLGETGEYSHLQKRVARTLVGDLTALKDDDPRKAEVRRRVAYIQAIVKARPAALTDEHIAPILERVRAERGDRTAPSGRTIRRWHKEFMSAGEDIRALVPATCAKGNRTRRLCKDLARRTVLLRLIEQAIDEEYLRLERPTVQSCYNTLVARIAQDNRFREEGDKLPIPHKTTLYHIIRRLKKEDSYRHDLARFGKRIADMRHKAFGRKQEPTRALELVQCDDTQIDLFVIDEQTLMPLGRPYLMLIIDVYSRMILGFYLSFTKPSYLSVMQALLHAIRPKTYVKTKYPDIVHIWDTYGIPEVLNVDNAKFYHGKDLEDACATIGMAVEFSSVRKPWLKAQIERFFGTLNTQLLHGLPGTTFSNIFEKYDYDPAKNAVISLDRLEEALHRFIIDVYGQSRHRGIEDVPARRWDESIKQHQPMLPPAHTELDVLLGHVEHRVISKKGVELFGLFYNDDCLVKLRSELKKGEKAKVKIDPTNLGLIHVYDRARGRYLPVPAVAREYAEGLSMWQHNVIRRYARQRVDEHVNIIELCLAKERIRAMVSEYAGQVRGKRAGVKATRFLNPERTSPRARIENIAPEVAGLLTGETTDTPTETIPSYTAMMHLPDSVDNDGSVHRAHESVENDVAGTTPKLSLRRAAEKRSGRKGIIKPAMNPASVPDVAGATAAEDADLDMDGWGGDYDMPM